MGRLIALVAALLAGWLIAWAGERTPQPKPADAPAAEFSAARAMADVAATSPLPHPIGSPANARVRDHLLARMRALGLDAQVHADVGLDTFPAGVTGAQVENLVGVLPGRDREKPAVALMAHYDSVPGSPGAADDAAGVAAMLEAVRAIRARGVPARDVILLATDGEEPGLLGANAFFARDPLAKRIGLVVNLEARGSAGRAQMFQASPGNGGLIDLYRRNVEAPASSSLAVFVYRLMPNDTDLTEALAAGVPSLNLAFVGRQFDYHSATATPANLDRGSLQHLGDQALGLAAAAAFAPALPGKAPDVTYSQLFGRLVLAYPAWAGWLVLAAAAALIVLGLRRAHRIQPIRRRDLARGAGALVFALTGAVAVLQFARQATGAGLGYLEQRFLLAQAERWETALALIGLGFLLLAAAELARGRRVVAIIPALAGVGASAFGGFDPLALGCGLVAAILALIVCGRPVERAPAWAGVLLATLLLAILAQALAPTAAFVLAWPLLLAGLGAAATAFTTRRGPGPLAILGVLATLGLGWTGAFAHAAFVSMDFMPLLALPLVMAAPLLWPLAQPTDGAPPERWIGAGLLLAGLATTTVVRFAEPYSPRYPEASQVLHHLDYDAGRAFRISLTPQLPDWSRRALRGGGGRLVRRTHWAWGRTLDAAPTPFLAAPPPVVTLEPRADGAQVLRIEPAPGGRSVQVRLRPDVPVTLESLGGVAARTRLAPRAWTTVRWTGGPADLVLRPSARGSLEVRAVGVLPGWPATAAALPPRPADVMAWDISDSTVVTRTRGFAW